MKTWLEKIKNKIILVLLKKYALGYMVDGWEFITGYKTQVFFALTVLTWVAETLGGLPPEVSKHAYELFGSGAAFSFLQKLKRHKKIIQEVGGMVKGGIK